jgi:hypothetical protein
MIVHLDLVLHLNVGLLESVESVHLAHHIFGVKTGVDKRG